MLGRLIARVAGRLADGPWRDSTESVPNYGQGSVRSSSSYVKETLEQRAQCDDITMVRVRACARVRACVWICYTCKDSDQLEPLPKKLILSAECLVMR